MRNSNCVTANLFVKVPHTFDDWANSICLGPLLTCVFTVVVCGGSPEVDVQGGLELEHGLQSTAVGAVPLLAQNLHCDEVFPVEEFGDHTQKACGVLQCE